MFEQFVEVVKSQMQPPARANATASTLQQLSTLVPAGVTLADLAAGWRVLARPLQPDEEMKRAKRRATCGELADLAGEITSEPGNMTQAVKAWRAWTVAFEKSDDPRQAAMAATFAREYRELQATH